MSRLPVDVDAIRTLAAILDETNLTEIEVSEGDSRVRVARSPAPVAATAFAPIPANAGPSAQPGGTTAASSAAASGTEPGGADWSRHPGAVTSPMVGIAYLTAEPGAPPFVTEGQAVTAGQTIMLIEAMKTFNQIKAPKNGTVLALVVAPGAPVEFGEVLAVIE